MSLWIVCKNLSSFSELQTHYCLPHGNKMEEGLNQIRHAEKTCLSRLHMLCTTFRSCRVSWYWFLILVRCGYPRHLDARLKVLEVLKYCLPHFRSVRSVLSSNNSIKMAFSKCILLALTATLLFKPSLAIIVCPTTEATQTATSGFKYALCPNTDLQGGSAQVLQNTATLSACVLLCDANPACLNAVYDKTGKVCHVKVKNAVLTWVVNNQFDVVQLRNAVPENENIARCGVTETIYTRNAKTFNICRGSDFQGASASATNNIASVTACAALCAANAACSKAVYDHVGLVCHIKGPDPATTLIVCKFLALFNDFHKDFGALNFYHHLGNQLTLICTVGDE